MYEASLLNETVKEIVEQLVELNDVSDVSLNSDYNYTDTETKKYRYQQYLISDIIRNEGKIWQIKTTRVM